MASACGSGGLLPVGATSKGETIAVALEATNRVQEVRFRGKDDKHYLLLPANEGNELVVIRLKVHNSEATRVLMTVDKKTAELRGFGIGETYTLVDINQLVLESAPNVQVVDSTHPAEDRYSPFLAGPFELLKGYGVIGWVIFEVPRGTKLREMRWEAAGDVVFLRS